LEAVTLRENRDRRNARKRTCRHGHVYTPGNTYWQRGRDGYLSRVCLTCRALNDAPASAGYRYRPRAPACPQGHVYTPETARIHQLHTGRRQRVCVLCRRAQMRSFRDRRRSAGAA
jgi:hypothetical protein